MTKTVPGGCKQNLTHPKGRVEIPFRGCPSGGVGSFLMGVYILQHTSVGEGGNNNPTRILSVNGSHITIYNLPLPLNFVKNLAPPQKFEGGRSPPSN